MRALHPLHLLAIMTLSLAGLRSAHAQEPPCEVCVSRAVVERCAEDARQVDAARGRVVACQRQVDAAAGASAELRAQLLALRAAHEAEAAVRREEIAALSKRPRWRAVVIGVGAGLVAGAVVWELAR